MMNEALKTGIYRAFFRNCQALVPDQILKLSSFYLTWKSNCTLSEGYNFWAWLYRTHIYLFICPFKISVAFNACSSVTKGLCSLVNWVSTFEGKRIIRKSPDPRHALRWTLFLFLLRLWRHFLCQLKQI